VLSEYSVGTDWRGFYGLSHGYVASLRRGNPGHLRSAARGGTRDEPAGPVLAATPAREAAAIAGLAPPGTNLLLNPAATAGATSAQGWDAVTIPGWQIAGGLPTVVRYGTPGFPKAAKSWPANRGNLFAGGAGGTAKLVQQASVTPKARYDIAAWLGGTKTSAAELTVQFLDTGNRILGAATTGPAGKQAKPALDYRQAAGTVPAGATRARVTITLTTTSLTGMAPTRRRPATTMPPRAISALLSASRPPRRRR